MEELVYVYVGSNEYLLDKKVDDEIEKLNIDEINIIKYDLIESKSEDVLEDLMTISFFAEKKVIIVKNLDLLTKEDEFIVDKWVSYLKNPNPDTYLFIMLKELINDSFKIGKAINQYGYIEKIKDFNKDDLPKYLIDLIDNKGYKISLDAVNELILRTDSNLLLIQQELEKLMLYKYDTKDILINDIKLLVSRNLEDNIFELTNNLIYGNKKESIQIFNDLILQNEDPLRIINNISLKLREIMHTKILIEKGYSQDSIQKYFNISRGRAYYLVKNAMEVSLYDLEYFYDKLANLDFSIKSGKIDKKLGLELFLLGA